MKTELSVTGRMTGQHAGDWLLPFSPGCAGSGVNEGRLFNTMCVCAVWLTHPQTSWDIMTHVNLHPAVALWFASWKHCGLSHMWHKSSDLHQHTAWHSVALATWFFWPVMIHAAGDQSLNPACSSTAMWGSRQLTVISVRQTGYNEEDWLMHQNQQKDCVQLQLSARTQSANKNMWITLQRVQQLLILCTLI